MLVKKFTLVVDDMWLREIIKHWDYVEAGEVFQLLDEEDIEVCDDCQSFLTKDGEVVMDCYRCPDQKEFCLNCCQCPGEHEEGNYYE